VYVPPAPPAAFHVVSEHVEAVEESHKPVRRRKQSDADGGDQSSALQLVETQAATPPPVVEDELPRRTKPRKRRGAAADSEPLMLVETQGTAETPHSDIPPTP
jgi:hypothetical protein